MEDHSLDGIAVGRDDKTNAGRQSSNGLVERTWRTITAAQPGL